MSRVIPVPNKGKKKVPPPPRPQITIAFQQSPVDEQELERPQKIQLPPPDQPEKTPPQEDSPVEIPKQQPVPPPQQVEVVEGEPQVIMVVPPIKKALPKKAIVPPNPKSKKPIPPPFKMDLQVKEIPLESTTTEPSVEVEENIEIVQVKNEETKQPVEAKVEAPVEQKIETVNGQSEVEQQQFPPQPVIIQKIDISSKPPAPPKPIKKGKTPPPPAKMASRVPPPSPPPISPIVQPKEEIAVSPAQQTAQQIQVKKVQPKQKIADEPVKVEHAKVVEASVQYTLQAKPIIIPNPPAQKPIVKQIPLLPSAPPKQVKVQQNKPPSIINANPPTYTPTPTSVAKSSMSAKLEQLRRAKEQMLNDQPSDEENSENAEQIYSNRQDIVQEKDIQEQDQQQTQKIKEVITPKEYLPAEVKKEEITPILETPIFDAPVKTVPIVPAKPPARTLAPPKRIAPPPTVKNMPKIAEIKVEAPIPEQTIKQPIKQPIPSAQAQINSIAQASHAVEHKPTQKEEIIVDEVKPPLPVIPKVLANVAPVEKVKVKLDSKPQIEGNQQMTSLLQRYHTLKNGYLTNLRQLDDLIHFQRQQEDNEIDKINHLLADLHRRNVSIKQICSIKDLPSPIQQEEVAI